MSLHVRLIKRFDSPFELTLYILMVTAGLYTLNRVGQDKSPTGGSVSILKKFGYRMFRCTKDEVL